MRRVSNTGAVVRLACVVTFAALAMFIFAPGAFAQNQSAYLRWAPSASAVGNPSLTYNVYRANSCAGTFAKINAAPVASTVFLDNQPPPGSYCYQVTAVLSGVESNPSNDATATILPLQPQSQAPANPSAAPASAKAACSHSGDLVNWIHCVVEKARAKAAPPLPVH
ncbi:MAG: hypothetical protein ACRD5K_11670 [Candidatus Acidiferrales bacterium]